MGCEVVVSHASRDRCVDFPIVSRVCQGGDGDGGCMVLRSRGEVRQRGWAYDLTELGLATPATRARHHLISPARALSQHRYAGIQAVACLAVWSAN